MLRFLTAGESHGPALVAIVEGIPSGLTLDIKAINKDLERRQMGFGRGGRMKIESDKIEIVSGVRHGQTLGSPIALKVDNKDWENWQERMSIEKGPEPGPVITAPRPGHADLVGILKTDQKDIRNILERASARETAARVAVGAIAKQLLKELGIDVVSHVIQIGSIVSDSGTPPKPEDLSKVDKSPVRCFNDEATEAMVDEIKEAMEKKDTVGGIFEVLVYGVFPGIGGFAQWDERLNANLARALMSIPAIKGVDVGLGMKSAGLLGSKTHDEISYSKERGYFRETNRAGGIEGGMSNGETIVLKAAMKPIPTLGAPLNSVDIKTKKPVLAGRERSDICAVPSAAVIGEAMVAIEIVKAVQKKFGADSIDELKQRCRDYTIKIKGEIEG